MATVGELLNSAQDSAAASERCAGSLWKLALQDPDGTYESLRECVDYLVTIGQKSTYVERCIRFFGTFANKLPVGNEAAAAVIEELLQQLAGHLSALDKVVRYRSSQMLQQVLSAMPDSALLEDSVAQVLRSSLLERLHDKLPAVRAEAVRAVSHLTSADEEGQSIVEALTGLLETDKSKDVRIAVVQSLPLDAGTLPVLLQRMRDVNPLVRKALVLRLRGLPIKLLSIKQRTEVIQQVLQDRDAAVADAAAKLLAHWLAEDCDGSPLQLLQLLDVETYTEPAALAIETLISNGSINTPNSSGQDSSSGSSHGVTAFVEAACQGSSRGSAGLVGLRVLAEQQHEEGQLLLDPHEALMWRCLCEWLRSDAISKGLAAAATGGARAAMQAAVAAERHEVLERALPDSADELMQLVMRHASAGPAARFAAAQLMMIASTCVEWADAASRAMALPYLQQLIALNPTAEAEQDDHDDESMHSEDCCHAAGLQLAGNGGDGMFEAAVVQLVLAVQGPGAGFTVAMLDGIAPLAAAAGLLPKPGSELEEPGALVTVCVAEPSQVLQCLTYISLLLQHLPSGRPVTDEGSVLPLSRLWELLLLLALKQDQPDIRAKAVECIGLYALAGASNPGLLSSAVQLLGPLLVAGGCSATQQAAVRGLVDTALLFGPAAVDAVLRGPRVAAVAATAAGAVSDGNNDVFTDADEGNADADMSTALSKGLVELLVLQAEALLAEAQAPTAVKAKRGARAASANKAEPRPLSTSTAELLAAVAESLGKLLLHQRVWLRRYEHWVPPTAGTAGQEQAVCNNGTAVNNAGAAAEAGKEGASAVPAHGVGFGVAGSSWTAPFPTDSRQQQALLLRRALALLLQLQFHPATEDALRLRQCLSVFFDVFTAAAPEFKLQLVAACLPAARQALHITCKKNPAALLVKYVLQLLQAMQQHDGSGDQRQKPAAAVTTLLGESYEQLAQQLMAEVDVVAPVTVGCGVQPAKYKPYLSAVLKVVCELPLHPSHEDLAVLQLLSDRLSTSITDATLKKDVASVQLLLQRLAQEAGADQRQLQPEQLDALVEQMQAVSLQTLVPLPGAAGAAVAAAAAAAGSSTGEGVPATPAAPPRITARKSSRGGAATAGRATGARTAAAGRRAAAATARSSEEEESESSSEPESATDDSGSESDDSAQGLEAVEAAAAAASSKVAAAAAPGRAAARRSSARQPLGPSTVVNSQQ